ncbi:MAG: FAD-dependent oxidoreductase, partial [Candidatus Omnitrophica bacterium]|nr:FAD-dependent oxidoreductase [Candidatus Omnitrophota bacterium]
AGEKIDQGQPIEVKGKKVVIIGGGDTGSDCLGTALRQRAACLVQIELLPQPPECRSQDFPWPHYPLILKTSSSHQEGGQRVWSVLTKSFIGKKGCLEKLSCVRVEFKKSNSKGCPIMKEIKGSEFQIEADIAILALGFLHPRHSGLLSQLKVGLDARGNVKTDDSYRTSLEKVFSAGDMRRGQSLVVWAIQEGRQAAFHIDKYLTGESDLGPI